MPKLLLVLLTSLSVSVLVVLYLLGYLGSDGWTYFDYTDKYEVIKSIKDDKTGVIVELGTLSNATSLGYVLTVNERPLSERGGRYLGFPIAKISSPKKIQKDVTFDGACYIIRSTFKRNWDYFQETREDKTKNSRLCFRIEPPAP